MGIFGQELTFARGCNATMFGMWQMYCKYRYFSGLTGICTAVAADPFFGISGTVSCVLQYKTVAANLKILCSHGDLVQIPCK